jgi:ankyrin repeat protein
MTMTNLSIFHQKRWDALPLHYAASRERGGSGYILQQETIRDESFSQPTDVPSYTSSTSLHRASMLNTASVFQCLLEADPAA